MVLLRQMRKGRKWDLTTWARGRNGVNLTLTSISSASDTTGNRKKSKKDRKDREQKRTQERTEGTDNNRFLDCRLKKRKNKK